jgi:hypothetical protein
VAGFVVAAGRVRFDELNRYLAEFDFWYSNRSRLGVEDQERTGRALLGITGKRLTYRGTDIGA